jgi:hypothetical protein
VCAVYHTENGLLLLFCAKYRSIQKSSCGLQAIHDAVGEVRVLVGALCQSRVGELAENGKLPTGKVDGIVDVVLQFVWLGDCIKDMRLLERRLMVCRPVKACWARHFDWFLPDRDRVLANIVYLLFSPPVENDVLLQRATYVCRRAFNWYKACDISLTVTTTFPAEA